MAIYNRGKYGLSEQGRYRVSDLLLLEADGPEQFIGIRKGLKSSGFADGKAPVLKRMDEHVLAKIADNDGGSVGGKAMV